MIDTTLRMPDGSRRHFQRRGYGSRKEAEADSDRAKEVFIESNGYSPDESSFSCLIDTYMSHESSKLKPTSAHSERLLLTRWPGRYFKGKSVASSFTSKELSLFRAWLLRESSKHPDLGNRVFRDLTRMSEYAFNMGFISMDELRLARTQFETVKREVPPSPEPKTWSIEEYRKFIGTFDPNDRFIVLFQWLFFSGCRIGEALGLEWRDIDIQGRSVSISRTCAPKCGTGGVMFMTPKTKAGFRRIFISEEMASQFADLKKAYAPKPESFVFFGGQAPIGRTTVRRVFDGHTGMAKLPRLKIHEIRHTNNTWLLEQAKGGSMDELKAISARLGRDSLGVTLDVYFHSKEETSKKLAKEIKI